MAILAAVKAALTALGAFFGFLDRKQLIDAGKDAAAGEQARETLDLAKAVHQPISDDERNSVWARLQAERGAKRRLPTDPGAGS